MRQANDFVSDALYSGKNFAKEEQKRNLASKLRGPRTPPLAKKTNFER